MLQRESGAVMPGSSETVVNVRQWDSEAVRRLSHESTAQGGSSDAIEQ